MSDEIVRVVRAVQIVGLVGTVVLAGLWISDPGGPWEPWILLVTLLSVSAGEHVARFLRERTSSWASVVRGARTLIDKMKADGFQPDLVVLYGRGGGVFGSLLAGNLGNVQITAIDREVVHRENQVESFIIEPNALALVTGKRVLMVDAEIVTGTALAKAKDAVEAHEPAELRTAAYHVSTTTNLFPDYYAHSSNSPIEVPWRLSSAYRRRSIPWLNRG